MTSPLIGSVVSELRVNLTMKVPTLLGFRARIAGALCSLAALVLGGKLTVELETDVETKTYDTSGALRP